MNEVFMKKYVDSLLSTAATYLNDKIVAQVQIEILSQRVVELETQVAILMEASDPKEEKEEPVVV